MAGGCDSVSEGGEWARARVGDIGGIGGGAWVADACLASGGARDKRRNQGACDSGGGGARRYQPGERSGTDEGSRHDEQLGGTDCALPALPKEDRLASAGSSAKRGL